MSLVEFDFLVDGEPRKISVEARDGTLVTREGGQVLETEVRRISANELQFRFGGRPVRAYLARDGERTYVSVAGRDFVVSEFRPESSRPGEGDEKAAEAGLRVKAPMPGKVTKVAVVEGEKVRKNQTLVIVEAMKMENEIKTAFDGVVTKIHVAVGDLVDSERPLIEVEKSKVPPRRSEP
jgi:biotin carboxyl carrier protein